MVILAKFRHKNTGELQLRTIGKNTFGLLGQGKDVKESATFKKVQLPPMDSLEQVIVG